MFGNNWEFGAERETWLGNGGSSGCRILGASACGMFASNGLGTFDGAVGGCPEPFGGDGAGPHG